MSNHLFDQMRSNLPSIKWVFSYELVLSTNFEFQLLCSLMAARINYVVLALAVCLVIEDVSPYGCWNMCPTLHVEAAIVAKTSANLSRKMLPEQVFRSPQVRNFHGGGEKEEGVNLVDWTLRSVPSGPDPMHHNIGGPKKPQAP